MSQSDKFLKTAMTQMKHNDRQGAIQSLKHHLQDYPTDPRGWWAMANVVEEVEIRKKCLERVLQLNPSHDKAHTLLMELNAPPQINDEPEWLHTEAAADTSLFAPDNAVQATDQAWLHAQDADVKPLFDLGAQPVSGKAALLEQPTSHEAERILEVARQKREQHAKHGVYEQQKRSRPFVWIGLGLILLATVVAIGAVYMVFFAGPDLGETTENEYLSIKYPRGWVDQAADTPYNLVVMSTEDIPLFGIDPWTAVTDTGSLRYSTLSARYELQYWTHYFEWGRLGVYDENGDPVNGFSTTTTFQRLRSDKLAIAIVQVVPNRAERPYDGADYVRAVSQWFEGELEREGTYGRREIITAIEDVEIDGHIGTFTTIQFHNEVLGNNSYEAIYFANLTLNDTDYLMIFTGVERKLGEWRDTAYAMAESININ